MEQEIVDFNGQRFNAFSIGPAERDVVILLHGFPQFADVWTGMMHALAAGGLRAQAFDQRGYSPGAHPLAVEDYDIVHLTSDVLAFADQAGASRFHLVGHDWGGFLAWKLAAEHPERVGSLCVLSTPHVDAFLEAARSDVEQQDKSKYIQFFKMPGGIAESVLLSDGAQRLRSVYQGKLAEEQIEANVRRLSEPGGAYGRSELVPRPRSGNEDWQRGRTHTLPMGRPGPGMRKASRDEYCSVRERSLSLRAS